jgi:hypothetical protein
MEYTVLYLTIRNCCESLKSYISCLYVQIAGSGRRNIAQNERQNRIKDVIIKLFLSHGTNTNISTFTTTGYAFSPEMKCRSLHAKKTAPVEATHFLICDDVIIMKTFPGHTVGVAGDSSRS